MVLASAVRSAQDIYLYIEMSNKRVRPRRIRVRRPYKIVYIHIYSMRGSAANKDAPRTHMYIKNRDECISYSGYTILYRGRAQCVFIYARKLRRSKHKVYHRYSPETLNSYFSTLICFKFPNIKCFALQS